ncbi:OsmC family protein [Vagococcus xieshaowenii]
MELPLAQGNWVLLREEGYSPVQSLVAATGACGAYVYQSVLENSKIPYTFHKVTINYERDMEHAPNPISSISMTFHVTIEEDLQDRATRALRLVSKHCPVIQSLNPTITIEELVDFI